LLGYADGFVALFLKTALVEDDRGIGMTEILNSKVSGINGIIPEYFPEYGDSERYWI